MLFFSNRREEANIFGHLVDSKREEDVVSLVITPYNHRCFNVTNQSEESDLNLDMHIKTRTPSARFTARNLSSHFSLLLLRDPPLPLLPTVPLSQSSSHIDSLSSRRFSSFSSSSSSSWSI